MSFINSNVPTIAITPDEGSNTNYDISHSIDEVATDVEDIYFQTEKRKKKTRIHVQKKDMYATDVEDLDGSDDDFSNPIIKHDHPISINQVLDFDIPTTEENVKVDDAKSKNRRKLRTQASVSSSTNYLELNETELDNILTDLEDFDKSDEEDEASDLETSDTDLLKEIIHDSGTIAISDSVKKFLQAVPSPMATPVDGSDNEVDNSKITTKLYKNKKYISPVLTNLNDLTDTEELQCDEVKPKHKYGKNRRHTLPRKSKLDVTDDEDFEVSDNELKHRRVTVANLPKINFDEADKKTNRSLIKIPQNFNDGDSDYEEIAMFKNLQYQQSSNQFLNVSDTKNDHTTDIESMDDDSELEIEENIPNEDYSYELETSNDIIEDKFSVKNNNIYKIEESSIQKKCENWNSTENETDEETDKCESEINKPEVKHEATNIKFVHRYKKVQKIDKPNKLSLLVPSTGDENVLTDVENLDSSDDEINEIPVTVVNDLNDDYTDTESVEGEIENHTLYDIDFNVLPSCSRKLVREKEDNNYSEIVSTSLTDENVDTIDLSNETDLEELSGDDLQESYTEKYFAIELDVADANNTQYKDSLKLPTKQKFDEEETDTEDIDNMKIKPKKYKRNYHTYRDDNGKHTDIEDLVMSETENFSNLQVVDNIAGKTDTEDFDASDNEERVVPEYSRTPDILRQMGRDSVCSQEGSGLFSRQDKEKLDSKHTHNTVDIVRMSPSPTNTDEFITSADDDNFYSRADTATPVQMQQELDEASSFKVHSQNTKKIDLDAEDEVMYLKGGGFLPDVYTDTEEMGISEEEYYSANDKLLKDEWSSTKSPSDIKTSQEPVTTDAAPQEQASGSSTTTFSGSAAANILRDEGTPENLDPNDPMNQQLRDVPDQHQLSTEMKELLEEMEKHSKQ